MSKVLIYSGTTEGKHLANLLAKASIACDVSVATEYGRQVMEESDYIHVLEGRMDEEKMRELYATKEYEIIVDATHPFATIVTDTIVKSVANTSLTYLRLARDVSLEEKDGVCFFDSVEACEKALENTTGNILLTTGSKELKTFCEGELKERLVVRVLPGMESLQICYDNGLEGKQIIAMQGPFSKEMNLAQLHQYDIQYLVTKESGITGGVEEKLAAAKEAGVVSYIIRKPDYSKVGELSFETVCEKLSQHFGMELLTDNILSFSLVGIGMGSSLGITKEASMAIEEADYVFGAKRMLDSMVVKGKAYPYYLWKDIEPVLKEIKGSAKIAILFSGDTGFFSGCEKLYEKLNQLENAKVRILPGISSLSYMASKIGISYQDERILSLHGVEEKNWLSELTEAIRTEKKVFFLTSGVMDVQRVFNLCKECGARLYVGYQLSYENERVFEMTEIGQVHEDGLYVGVIINDNPNRKILTPHLSDEDFIRAQVPMTKEEVRHLSVCKLWLTKGSVVYDIGSGTGSIAVEMASLASSISVYAIETKPEAVELIRENCKKHQLSNITVIEAMAPEGFETLPKPTHAFIGGSKGNLKEIIDALKQKNSNIRIVMNAVSMESICQMQQLLKQYDVKDLDITQISITKTRKLGAYNMLQANNPVFIFAFTLT